MISNNFNEIYLAVLTELRDSPDYIVDDTNLFDKERVSGFRELNGYQFKLTNIDNNTIEPCARNFNQQYADAFFNYVMTGDDTDVRKNPKAVKYLEEFEGRNTQYGPRIRSQLFMTIKELKRDRGSRRGTIMILEGDDQLLFKAKASGECTIEYPCTNSLTFSIRDNKLHLVSNMRSQSAAMVMPYDIYNWTNLMKHVAKELEVECGTLTHQVASLHYFNSEQPLVDKVLS